MQIPLNLTFKQMDASPDLESLVRQRVDRLEQFFKGITSCHVVVTGPQLHHRQGDHHAVSIEVRVPGTELAVNHQQHDVARHEHATVAIRDAFAKMERQLKRWKQKISGDVKAHEGHLQGRIAEIHREAGHGQIIATDSRLIYFHRNSVVDGSFDDLNVGDTVALVVQTEDSEIGPQASTVRPIGALRFLPR